MATQESSATRRTPDEIIHDKEQELRKLLGALGLPPKRRCDLFWVSRHLEKECKKGPKVEKARKMLDDLRARKMAQVGK